MAPKLNLADHFQCCLPVAEDTHCDRADIGRTRLFIPFWLIEEKSARLCCPCKERDNCCLRHCWETYFL